MSATQERGGEPVPVREALTDYLKRLEAMSPEEQALERERTRLERAAAAPPPQRAAVRWPETPTRFAKATIDEYKPENDAETRAQRAVAKWVPKAAGPGGILLALIGDTGVGKSHLLWGAARALREMKVPFYARPWYLLADELRYGGPHPWSGGATEEPAGCRHALWHSRRVVLLDEVDHTSGTDFDRVELKKFVHHAWDQRYAVLITTPVAPLSDVLGLQAASRFVQVQIQGRDRRTAP